jgi:hypothetical protein
MFLTEFGRTVRQNDSQNRSWRGISYFDDGRFNKTTQGDSATARNQHRRKHRSIARIAQSVEQRIENPRVGGSIPSPGTITQAFQTN